MTDPSRRSIITLGSGDDLARLRAEVESLSTLVRHLVETAVPFVVVQAQDSTLPRAAKDVMWNLRRRLTTNEYRDVYYESVALETGRKDNTVGQMLNLLVREGFLEELGKRKPRAFRFPASQRSSRARAA